MQLATFLSGKPASMTAITDSADRDDTIGSILDIVAGFYYEDDEDSMCWDGPAEEICDEIMEEFPEIMKAEITLHADGVAEVYILSPEFEFDIKMDFKEDSVSYSSS